MKFTHHLRWLLCAGFLAAACGSKPSEPPAPPPAPPAPAATPEAEELPPVASPYDALPVEERGLLHMAFQGDLDEMVSRRLIRAGVAVNRTHYFIDRGVQRGIAYDSFRLFEQELNEEHKTGLLKVNVAFVPLSRDQLLVSLKAGLVDVVAASLTITPERLKDVDFSIPTRTNVSQIVVSGPGSAALSGPDALSGQTVFVRKSSSYYASLKELNDRLTREQKAPVTIAEAPETLEDDDILEMVNAGLVPLTVVDDYLAEFWSKVFKKIRLQKAAAVHTGDRIGVAVRKGNPKLLAAVNAWIKKYGRESVFGQSLEKRYLQSTRYVVNATSAAERKRLLEITELFKKYGDKYDMDFLLMAAQGFQESRLDQNARSHVGAIGVMQIMPATGAELGVGDITKLEPNINGGVKYMRQLIDGEFKDQPMDRLNMGLMAFAAYNAGPGRLRALRRETQKRGLDPNLWFNNVEQITSERIGRETVDYVSNIYKYYIAYKLVMEQRQARQAAGK
jgi:membrane-bound lytic murein transglycosylase MltF